jgi:hypothetical protein
MAPHARNLIPSTTDKAGKPSGLRPPRSVDVRGILKGSHETRALAITYRQLVLTDRQTGQY